MPCSKRSEKPVLAVEWKAAAQNDLANIIDYVEQRNPRAAIELHADIVKAAESLAEHPFLYRKGRVVGTREAVVHPNYIVIYRVGSELVSVLRVMHAHQNYP